MRSIWVSMGVLLLLLLPASLTAAESETLVIAADVWCPINCDPNDKQQGLGVEVARAVFEPLGYTVRYEVMPWVRVLEEAHEGTVDIVIAANPSDDPNLLYPTHALMEMTDDFYVLKDNPVVYTDIDSLKGMRVGIISGYGYDPVVNAYLSNARTTPGLVQEVFGDDALQQNIRKLLAGRIDLIIESGPIMDDMLKKTGQSELLRHLGNVPQGNIYLAFSPAHMQSQKRVEEYEARIKELRASGKLAAIYDSYKIPLKP